MRLWASALALSMFTLSASALEADRSKTRRTTRESFATPIERHVLPSGLTVLLSPDPKARSVAIVSAFRAGHLADPPGRAGLANVARLLLVRGPDADYPAQLEDQGAFRDESALTADGMRFTTELSPEGLPLALWVAADRVGRRARAVTAAELPAAARTALAARDAELADREYGLVDELVARELFGAAHPLASPVAGTRETLAAITEAELTGFLRERIAPANGVLAVTGAFEPKSTLAAIEHAFAGMEAGRRASFEPRLAPMSAEQVVLTAPEPIGGRPRVTLAWRIAGQGGAATTALELLGRVVALQSTEEVESTLVRVGDDAMFRLDFHFPYEIAARAAISAAEAAPRVHASLDPDRDLLDMARLALDRARLGMLAAPAARAEWLADAELHGDDLTRYAELMERHWTIEPVALREVAKRLLSGGRVVMLAQPTTPRRNPGSRSL